MSDAARSALRAADEDIKAGRYVTLTEAELREWESAADGDLPASVQERFRDLPACPALSR